MKSKKTINALKAQFPAKSCNEAFARSVISAFVAQLDPTIEELCDLKTAVSEAVTNCIVHAYANDKKNDKNLIYINAYLYSDGFITIKIKDKGCGIENVPLAMEPMYTRSSSEERSGMGFSIMQCFTDKVTVKSKVGKGTTVTLKKKLGTFENDENVQG